MFLLSMLLVVGLFGIILGTLGMVWGKNKVSNMITIVLSLVIVSATTTFMVYWG